MIFRRLRHSSLFAFVVFAVLTAGCHSAEEPRQPTSTSAATPIPSGPPVFSAWAKYESNPKVDQAQFADNYIDLTLGHQVFQFPPQGIPSIQARELLLDDDKLLLPTGRRLWGQEMLFQPGFTGKFCYIHSSFCSKKLFDVGFVVDGKPLVVYDNMYGIERYPSHTMVRYSLGSINIDEAKYITYDDRAVATYQIRSADKKPHDVRMEVEAPYLTMPNSSEASYPLLGSGNMQQNPLYVYLDAPGFERADTALVHLSRKLAIAADGTNALAQVAVSYENSPRNAPTSLPDDLLARHRREYNQWFFDNVPYFDASDQGFKRMWYYRWWVVRFNMTEADTPDLSGYRFYEGKLGFDNPITFAVPVQLKELSYLRDPKFGLSQIRNTYRNLSPTGAVVDPPGSPYWGESYSHWIAAAVLEFSRVHPIAPEVLRGMLNDMARDVRAWVTAFDGDGDGLPQSARPRITGYDLDILSYWYFDDLKLNLRGQPPDLERVDFASFVYANARALAELAGQIQNLPIQREFTEVADNLQRKALASFWDDQTHFFYPQRAEDNQRIPVRELHGFFPFLTGLAPDEPRYRTAIGKLVDPEEFWARYPPVITSLYHYKRWTWDMDGLTRNIAPHPISMGARTLLQILKHYDQTAATPAHFMDLMERYNELVFPGVHPFDRYWRPNVHEYYSKWEPHQASSRPKPSDISHDFHSMYCSLVVEGVVGLTPRSDEKIELRPMARDWSYFLLDRLRYHGKDLTIVWDRPDGQKQYADFPEGFSLYVDGKLAFTRPQIDSILYDPADGSVAELKGPSPF
ncbi:MAG TPA: hypothetical protein VMT89_17310 [Candidatus Acidoferrales bacterium]|nr:hypothetical protein [Candidatus Acidoferrales bacterium]